MVFTVKISWIIKQKHSEDLENSSDIMIFFLSTMNNRIETIMYQEIICV